MELVFLMYVTISQLTKLATRVDSVPCVAACLHQRCEQAVDCVAARQLRQFTEAGRVCLRSTGISQHHHRGRIIQYQRRRTGTAPAETSAGQAGTRRQEEERQQVVVDGWCCSVIHCAVGCRQEMKWGGGVFCKEMKWGMFFYKKVDLSPQNETKLMLDLTHPPAYGTGVGWPPTGKTRKIIRGI